MLTLSRLNPTDRLRGVAVGLALAALALPTAAAAHGSGEPLFDPWPTPSGIDFTEGLWTDAGHITNDNDPDCPDADPGTDEEDCPHVDPVHGFLLHDETAGDDDRGKLVLFRDHRRVKVYNLNYPNLTDPSDSSNFYNFSSSTDADFFCSGHAYLPDGRLMIVGGTWDLTGVPATRCWVEVFDPADDTLTSFADAPGEPENPARYYPTCVAMPDGSVLVVGGDYWVDLNDNGQVESGGAGNETFRSEVWTQFSALNAPIDNWMWSIVPNRILEVHSEGWTQFYARMRMLPRGLFWEGRTLPDAPWALWPWTGASVLTDYGVREGDRDNSAVVVLSLYPDDSDQWGGKLFQVGGGKECVEDSGDHQYRTGLIYDFDVTTPTVTFADSSTITDSSARRRPDAVLLPNGKVLVMGGHFWVGEGGDEDVCDTGEAYTPNLSCELYDPGTDSWEPMDSLGFPHMYHSQALMLPDGRVFISGNEGFLTQAGPGYPGFRYEIFMPPDLMDSGNSANNYYAERPTIDTWETEIGYDGTFEIEITPVTGATVDTVMIMRPSSSTHSNDTDQRRVVLAHSVGGGGELIVNEPPDGTWAPPGVYMLIVLDSRGVWSGRRPESCGKTEVA
jgi:hypothetical protein